MAFPFDKVSSFPGGARPVVDFGRSRILLVEAPARIAQGFERMVIELAVCARMTHVSPSSLAARVPLLQPYPSAACCLARRKHLRPMK